MSQPSPEPVRERSCLLRWVDAFVPSLGGRPDVVLKERLLVACSPTLAIAAVLFGVHAARLQGGVGGISLTLGIGAVLALSYPLLLRRTGNVALPGTLITLEFAVLVVLVASFGNGFEGAALIWLPAVPLLAAFFVGPRAAMAMAAFAAAAVGLLFVVDEAGLLPADVFSPAQLARLRLLALVAGLGLSAFLGWLYESQTLRGLRRVNRELRAAKEQAEASERLKSALLMNMSHEVRTPLTGIMGVAELLQEETTGELSDLAGSVYSNGARLFATLDAVLDLAQIESGILDVHPEPIDLGRSLARAAAVARPAAARKGLALDVDRESGGSVLVAGDDAMVERILTHLLDNAIKFTEEGGVVLRVRVGASAASVEVADTGIGIASDFVPHLFEPFRQESDGLARSHEGSGLGLTVAHRLALLLGGAITVESEKGQGATFRLTLPLAGADAASPEERQLRLARAAGEGALRAA